MLKNEILQQRQKGLEEQNRLQEQAFKDMERTHQEHVNQIVHQMEKEQERIRRDNERVLEAKLKVKTGHRTTFMFALFYFRVTVHLYILKHSN